MQISPVPRLRSLSFLARLLAISTVAVASLAAPYPITELVPPPGLTVGSVSALNASGQLAVVLLDPSQISPNGVPKIEIALWEESKGFTLLPDFGTDMPMVWRLTDNGVLLGSVTTADRSSTTPFVWSASLGLLPLQPAGYNNYSATGMSEAGLVIGIASSPTSGDVALAWDLAGGFRELGSLGGSYVSPYTVTPSGTVVGVAGRADGSSAVFVWDSNSGLRDISGNSAPFGSLATSDRGSVVWFGYDPDSGARTFFTWDATRGMRSFAAPTDFQWFTPSLTAPTSGGNLFVGWDMFSGTFVLDPDSTSITALHLGGSWTAGNARNQFAASDPSGGFLIWDRVHGGVTVPLPSGWSRALPQFINNNGVVFGQAILDTQFSTSFAWSQTDGFQLLVSPELFGGYPYFVQDTTAVVVNFSTDGTAHYYVVKLPSAVAGKPDLQITGFTVTPDPKKTPASSKGKGKGKGSEKDCDDDDSKNAKTATVKVFVANQGSGNAVASSTKIVDGKKLLTTLATPAIPAGQSVTLTYTWDLKKVEEGKHTLTATADSAAQVDETNETNNTLKTTFTIKED